MRRFAIRTVKNGAVRIGGKVFRVNEHHKKYDGRLDGLRFVFGIYQDYKDNEPFWCNFVSLWGTEQAYKSPEEYKPGPECIDDSYPWEWWEAKV